MMSYVGITPVRDEEDFLPELITSVRAQRVLPGRWIIIDDGSTDSSPLIIKAAAEECSWVEAHNLTKAGMRKPGGESVIMRFLPREVWQQYDFVARLDADLSFGPEYISDLMNEFSRDPTLGIASGTLIEPRPRTCRTSTYHPRGPSRIYSQQCFAAIGGLEEGLGWDTIDEVRAMMAGFHARSFHHIRAYHNRVSRSARGLWRGQLDAGRAAFAAGYSPEFILARSLVNIGTAPWKLGGILILFGYLGAWLRSEKRLADEQQMRFIRKQQRLRLIGRSSLWL
jgi:poly-beta-1,6-N-acetyl-D-glucosamine synthase